MTAKAFEDKQTAGQNRGQRDPSTWTEKAERTVFVRVYKRRFLRKYDLPYDLVKQGNNGMCNMSHNQVLILEIASRDVM